MDKATLAQTIRRELSRSKDWDVSAWQPARDAGLALYKGEIPARPADTSLSGAVSMDVADMTEAILAQMQPAFTGAPPIEFEPEDENDEVPAAAETFFCHRALSRNGQDFIAVSGALRDAMLARVGIMKVWTEEKTEKETLEFNGVEPGDLGMLISAQGNESRLLLTPEADIQPDETGRYPSIRVRKVTTERVLRFNGVAPENFRFWCDWASPTLAGCPFQAEQKRMVRGELYGLGIPDAAVDALPKADPDQSGTAIVRQPIAGDQNAADPALDEVLIWDVYIAVAYSEAGDADIVNCYFSANPGKGTDDAAMILSDPVEVEFTPYAAGQIVIQPHQFLGLSVADKIGPTQVAKSEVLRQWLDNLAYLNNGRLIVVAGGADPQAVVDNNKPGGVIPSLIKGGVEAIIGPDAGQSALAALGWLDKSRGEAGGASLDMQTSGQNIKGETWGGIERQYGAKELLCGLMLRTFAETGLREVYLLAHRNLRKYSPGEIAGKMRGQWQRTDPATWIERSLASVQVGVAGSQMQQRAAALRDTLGMQAQAMQAGLGDQLASQGGMYNAILALERAKGLDMPERYWLDPDSPQAKQAAQGKAQAAQQANQEQGAFVERVAALQAALGAWEKRLDASVKYFQAVMDAEVETMKVVGQSTAQLEALQTQGLIAAAQAVPREGPAEQVAREMGGAPGAPGAPGPVQ